VIDANEPSSSADIEQTDPVAIETELPRLCRRGARLE
jgi:hypothetical protein